MYSTTTRPPDDRFPQAAGVRNRPGHRSPMARPNLFRKSRGLARISGNGLLFDRAKSAIATTRFH